MSLSVLGKKILSVTMLSVGIWILAIEIRQIIIQYLPESIYWRLIAGVVLIALSFRKGLQG